MTDHARMAAGRIFVGVGGWSFAPWRGLFYPPGLAQRRELAWMAEQLSAVEINSTFYGMQKPATYQRWHDETPDDFVFTVKGPRFASNRSDLATAGPSIQRFLDSGVLRLGAKLGPINWQLSPGKPFVADEIAAFLSLLPKAHEGRSLRHAIEVRHPGFAVPGFVDLARRHGVAIVLAGDASYPQIANATAGFAYVRLMGTVDGEERGYPAAALARWARQATAIAEGSPTRGLTLVPEPVVEAGPRDVYLFVISGAKHRNPAAAMALRAKLEG